MRLKSILKECAMSEPKVNETDGFDVVTSEEQVVAKPESEVKKEATLEIKKEVKKEEKTELKVVEKKDESKDKDKDKDKEKKSSDDAATGDDTTGDDVQKKKHGVSKRIEKLIRQREGAKHKAESLERRNKELEQRLADRPKAKDKSQALKEPQEADFDTYDDYLDALDEHDSSKESSSEKKTKVKRETKKEEPGSLTNSQKTAMAVLTEKTLDAAEKYKDFEEVALDKKVPITREMLEALAECEDPAKVMMFLGNNLDECSDIADMSPAQQMREITRLDLTVDLKPKKPVKKTKAAEPITPVVGSDVQEKDLDKMSFNEYEAHQNKKEAKTWGW